MTLVKNKPKPSTTLHKKRIGEHHKKTDRYKKTYWPYLPMLGMIMAGLLLSSRVNSGVSALGINSNYTYLTTQNVQNVSVAQAILRSPDTAIYLTVAFLFIASILLFSYRSYKKINKFFIHTEEVLVKHYSLDFALAIFITFGVVLTKQLS
jgi:hypothetical protein